MVFGFETSRDALRFSQVADQPTDEKGFLGRPHRLTSSSAFTSIIPPSFPWRVQHRTTLMAGR